MAQVAAVILAAGLASRYRAADTTAVSKVLADLDGAPLVRHVIDAALCSRAAPVIVVTGHAHDAVETALADADIACVYNPDYATGLASSLKAGVKKVPASSEAAIILLADMPKVSTVIINRLIEAFAAQPDAMAVVPILNGRRGNPVLLARALFAQVMQLKGDQGAKPILDQVSSDKIVQVVIDDAAITADVDTPHELEALRKTNKS